MFIWTVFYSDDDRNLFLSAMVLPDTLSFDLHFSQMYTVKMIADRCKGVHGTSAGTCSTHLL